MVTHTACSVLHHRWLTRLSLTIAFPYYYFFAPFIMDQVMKEDSLIQATSLSTKELKKYTKFAKIGLTWSFIGALVCLINIDIPVMSNEDYSLEKLNGFESLMRYAPSFNNWLFHLFMYIFLVIFGIMHSWNMRKIMTSLNNTFIDPDLVVTARRVHGVKYKLFTYNLHIISAIVSLAV